jgi:hypothetical protein
MRENTEKTSTDRWITGPQLTDYYKRQQYDDLALVP